MVFSNPWNHSNQLYYTQYEGTCIYLAKSTDNQVSHPVATVWRAMTPAWKKIAFPLRDLCLEETRRRDSVSAWARGQMAPLMQGPIFFSDQLHIGLPSPERSSFMQNKNAKFRTNTFWCTKQPHWGCEHPTSYGSEMNLHTSRVLAYGQRTHDKKTNHCIFCLVSSG